MTATELIGRDNIRLPNADQINQRAQACLDQARQQLEQAAAWLRSDHSPVGTDLTTDQVKARRAMRTAINAARSALDDGQWI